MISESKLGSETMKRFWPFLILFLLPILPLRDAIFSGNAIGPWDQIRQFAPWAGPEPAQPWDVLQADGALQFAQWRSLVLESWSRGQIPIWNPYQFGGTALAGNSQSGAFYPLHIALGLLQVGVWPALTILAWIHLAIAGWGTYAFARRMGATELGGFVAGATFAMSPFMLSWTGLPSVITTVCWIPVGLAIITCAAMDEDQSWLRPAIRLAITGFMMASAGHLQFFAYGAGAWIFWALATLPMAIRYKRAKVFGLAGLVAALMMGLTVAPVLAPILEFSQFSHRRNTPTAEGYEAYVSGAIKPFELANLGGSTVLGNPREYVEVGGAKAPGYWVPFVKRGANFAESAVTVGALALILLAFAPWKRPSTIAVAVLGGLALLVAMGTPINQMLYFGVPGWSSTGSPGRAVCLFILAIAVLAGLGVGNMKRHPIPFLVGALLVLGPIGLYSSGLGDTARIAEMGLDPQAMQVWVKNSLTQGIIAILIGLIIAAIAATAVIGEQLGKLETKHLAPIVVGVVIAGVAFQPAWVMTGKPLDPVAADAPIDRRFAFINEPWEIVAAAPAIVPPNLASGSRRMDLAGYDSLIHRDTVALLNDINGQDSAPPANGNMMFIKPSADPEKLRAAGVTEVWSRRPLPESFGVPTTADNYHVYSLGGPGVISSPYNDAKLLALTPNGLNATATGPGTATIRFHQVPGMRTLVNGKPVEVKPGQWIDVELADGENFIEVSAARSGLPYFAIVLAALLVGGALVRSFVILKDEDDKDEPANAPA